MAVLLNILPLLLCNGGARGGGKGGAGGGGGGGGCETCNVIDEVLLQFFDTNGVGDRLDIIYALASLLTPFFLPAPLLVVVVVAIVLPLSPPFASLRLLLLVFSFLVC